jgi:hypothetical protein
MTALVNTGKHGTGTRGYSRDRGSLASWGISGSGFTTPEDWGAIGDGTSHQARDIIGVSTIEELREWNGGIYWFAEDISDQMDWLGWQAGLYNGGVLTARPGGDYYIQKMLTMITGRTVVDATKAFFNFSEMVAETTSVNLIPSPTFASGWANTTQTPRTDWVFGAGVATFTDPVPGTGTSFGQMGRQLTIPAGRWRVEFTVEMTPGASSAISGLPICGLGWYSDGIGFGELTYPQQLRQTLYTDGPTLLHRDFELDEPLTVWAVWSAFNADVVISDPVLKPFLFNCAFWATGDGALDEDNDKQEWFGGRIFGPGKNSGISCFLQKTFGTRAAQLNLHYTEIGMRHGRGFTGAIRQSDRAYLSSISDCGIGYCDPAWIFENGAFDAGENLLINRTTLFNEGSAIDLAGGSKLNIRDSSFDYHATNRPAIQANNQALITTSGVHIEQEAKSVEALQMRGGSKFVAGEITFVQAGAATASANAYALVESNLCEVALETAWIYGTLTAGDVFARGAGRVNIGRFLGPGNANIPNLLIENFQMDRFGGAGKISGPVTASDMSRAAPPDGVGMKCGIYTNGVPMARLDTPGYAYAVVDTGIGRTAGCGSLKLFVDPAWPSGAVALIVLYPVVEGRVAFDRYFWSKPAAVAPIAYGPFAVPACISTVAGSNIITITDAARQFTGGEGPNTGWPITIAGAVAVGGIAAGSINGTRNVITRSGGTTWTVQAGAAATSTVSAGGGAGVTLAYSQTSVRIFNRRFFVAEIGQDAAGRPMFGQDIFAGEIDFDVPLAATPGWTVQKNNSWYTGIYVPADPMLERYGDGRAPAWATHMAIQIDFQHLRFCGAGVALHVTDFFANC